MACKLCYMDKAQEIYKYFKEYIKAGQLFDIDDFLKANIYKQFVEKCPDCDKEIEE